LSVGGSGSTFGRFGDEKKKNSNGRGKRLMKGELAEHQCRWFIVRAKRSQMGSFESALLVQDVGGWVIEEIQGIRIDVGP